MPRTTLPAGPLIRLNACSGRHLRLESELDEITGRMDAASQRRFPLSVQEAHLELIASGAVSRATLAWMLGIDADSLDVDAPDVPEVDVDDLANSALGRRRHGALLGPGSMSLAPPRRQYS